MFQINQLEDQCGSIWKDCSPGYQVPKRRSIAGRRSGIFKQLPVFPIQNVEYSDRVDSPEIFRAPDDHSANNSLHADISVTIPTTALENERHGSYLTCNGKCSNNLHLCMV